MPTPQTGEPKNKFMQRCVSMVMGDGAAEDNDQAVAMCSRMYDDHQKKQMMMSSDYLLDEYVSTKPGQAYRLLPFGVIHYRGKRREVTPAIAAQFKLPHFKAPIKRGSHDETAPANGHIVALEVREDGLYGIPEYTERGLQDLQEGAYRYHSPEVLWPGHGLEDPQTGEIIPGPLIVGDALLHTPHLGEAAALYSIEPLQKDGENMEDNVTIPKTLWEKFMAKLFPEPQPDSEPPAPPEPVIPDEYKAKLVELEQYKARVEQMEAEAARKAKVEKFEAEVAATKANREGLAELLAGLPDETAARIVQEFKALSAQIDESALTAEAGTEGAGAGDNPAAAFDAAVKAKMEEKKLSYVDAFQIVVREQPDLAKAAYKR